MRWKHLIIVHLMVLSRKGLIVMHLRQQYKSSDTKIHRTYRSYYDFNYGHCKTSALKLEFVNFFFFNFNLLKLIDITNSLYHCTLQNCMLLPLHVSETLCWSVSVFLHAYLNFARISLEAAGCKLAWNEVLRNFSWNCMKQNSAWKKKKTQSAWNSFLHRGLPKENPELKIVWIPGIKDCLIIHMH